MSSRMTILFFEKVLQENSSMHDQIKLLVSRGNMMITIMKYNHLYQVLHHLCLNKMKN